jgi:hypothetical protein
MAVLHPHYLNRFNPENSPTPIAGKLLEDPVSASLISERCGTL